jgi:maltoporin
MKKNFILAALPLALAAGPLLAQDTFELHGYARAGVGRSANGGEQTTFYLPGTGDSPTGGPGYRLGNETDNYIELDFLVRAYEKGDTNFKLHFRPCFREYYNARDASTDAGGNADGARMGGQNQQVWIREGWGEASGVLGNSDTFRTASIWAGRRFYMRQDMHMRDYWYWNDSGDGFGIEGINLGFGKLAYAYIQHDTGNVTWKPLVGSNDNWQPLSTPSGAVTVASHDLRLSDIVTNPGGSLTVGIQYNEANVKKDVANSGNNNNGIQYSLLHTQGGIFGGDNKVYLTYGDGNTFWNFYNPEVNRNNKWWEAMDILFVQPNKSFGMGATLIYRDQKNADGTHMKWTSLGARPVWFFDQHFSLAAEVGQDNFKFDTETETRHLLKETLALQWQPQPSWWSRPSIRLFVTHATWNTAAKAWGSPDGGQFGNATAGTTYGAQIEAWW